MFNQLLKKFPVVTKGHKVIKKDEKSVNFASFEFVFNLLLKKSRTKSLIKNNNIKITKQKPINPSSANNWI